MVESLKGLHTAHYEECEAILVHAVQKAFGKKALIVAIRQGRPFRPPGGCFH